MLVSSIIVCFFMCERHRLLLWLARTHLCKKIYVIAWQYVYNILILQHNSKGRNSLSDKLQQPTLATHCSNISCVLEKLCGNRCLSNRILLLQQVAQNQIRLNWCNLLQRQNSPVHTKQFVPPMCHATFCSNLSADLYTQSDLSLWPVAAHVA